MIKLTKTIQILSSAPALDSEGFSTDKDNILYEIKASVTMQKKNTSTTDKSVNSAIFAENAFIFSFRRLPEVSTKNVIVYNNKRFEITSITENKLYITAYGTAMEGSK